MRKLLLLATLFLATLSLSTLAWAEMADSNASDEQQPQAQDDFYSQIVSMQADQNGIAENAISPVALEFAEPANNEQPGAIAGNEGAESTGHDWYGQQVAIQAELNRRLGKAELPGVFEAE